MVSFIAKELGLSRKTVSKYRDSVEWIKEVFDNVDEEMVDRAQKFMSEKAGTNLKAAMFILRTKGRNRGFGDHMQVEANTTITAKVVALPYNSRQDIKPPGESHGSDGNS